MGKDGKYTDEELIVDLLSGGSAVLAFERVFHKYYPMVFGLLWANHNNTIPTKNMVASGRIIVDGVERDINASNYMEHVGFIKDPSCVTDITWVAPKN